MDRVRAQARGDVVGELMKGISYRKAVEGLTPYCLTQSLDMVGNDDTIDESIKVRILGLYLMNGVGPNVLAAAVKSLPDEMRPPALGQAGSPRYPDQAT